MTVGNFIKSYLRPCCLNQTPSDTKEKLTIFSYDDYNVRIKASCPAPDLIQMLQIGLIYTECELSYVMETKQKQLRYKLKSALNNGVI